MDSNVGQVVVTDNSFTSLDVVRTTTHRLDLDSATPLVDNNRTVHDGDEIDDQLMLLPDFGFFAGTAHNQRAGGGLFGTTIFSLTTRPAS